MATLNATQLTLYDHAKRLDPNGSVAAIAELLSQQYDILDDMVWQEGNLPTGHRITVRNVLPTVSWRAINAGVAVSKSGTAQVDESVGFLEGRSHIDLKLMALNGNSASFRSSENSAFIESMNQQFVSTLFNGNPGVDQKQYLGLSGRYASLTGSNSQNMLSAGGAGSDNASVWLVVWGPETVYGIYPKLSLIHI